MELDDICPGMRLVSPMQPQLGTITVTQIEASGFGFDLDDGDGFVVCQTPRQAGCLHFVQRTGHYALATDGRVDFEPVREGA